MLNTAISAALGYSASVLPRLLALYQDRKDKEHELKLLQLQLEHPQAMQDAVHYEVDAERAFRELPNILKSGDRKWDTFTSTVQSLVRPTITLLMFTLYAGFKLCVVREWSEIDTDLFAGVVFFWFGGRSTRR